MSKGLDPLHIESMHPHPAFVNPGDHQSSYLGLIRAQQKDDLSQILI